MCLWIWQPVRSQHVATAAAASATSADAGPTAEVLYTYVEPPRYDGYFSRVVLQVGREGGGGGEGSPAVARHGQREWHWHGGAGQTGTLTVILLADGRTFNQFWQVGSFCVSKCWAQLGMNARGGAPLRRQAVQTPGVALPCRTETAMTAPLASLWRLPMKKTTNG